MSTIQSNQTTWSSLAGPQLDPKYEKCRNITEEIYKRINITFQIKKLETGEQSDFSVNSDQIDSNELSNETDLFACDKSDISSSTEAERNVAAAACPLPVIVNNNNNEERSKAVVYKRPRKRFRKRVKKRPTRKRSDSEGSSDEAPLSRSLLILSPDLKPKSPDKDQAKKSSLASKNLTLRELLKPDNIKVPTVIIEKIKSIDTEAVKQAEATEKEIENPVTDKKETVDKAENDSSLTDNKTEKLTATDKKDEETIDKRGNVLSMIDEKKKPSKDVRVTDWKSCNLCNLSFRGERGLRRHMSMSHIVSPDINK